MKRLTALLSLIAPFGSYAGNVLYADTTLYMNQSIVSLGAKYTLIMQPDGNLVMYRQDGSVRWAAGKKGWFSIMQNDGNFVLYTSSYSPVFSTRTEGHPGAALVVQDDGNLVIYAPYGQGPLWWIGTDPGTDSENPHNSGDIVGRDLDYGPVLGPVGHVGLWDGNNVIEAMFNTSTGNAIEEIPLTQFKAASRYWGAAAPKIPTGFLWEQCYMLRCNVTRDSDYSTVDARTAIARRARQIMAIGADYTIFPEATLVAYPSYGGRPPTRGRYRCDTFIIDVYKWSTNFIESNSLQQQWYRRVSDLSRMILLPNTFYARVKSFD